MTDQRSSSLQIPDAPSSGFPCGRLLAASLESPRTHLKCGPAARFLSSREDNREGEVPPERPELRSQASLQPPCGPPIPSWEGLKQAQRIFRGGSVGARSGPAYHRLPEHPSPRLTRGAGIYRHLRHALLLLPLLLPIPLTAQSTPDSTRTDTITVTASRIDRIETEGTRSVTLIDRTMIERSGADDLADALVLSPGIFVKRYGGPGALATLSLRGTAAGQTLVMLDGIPWRGSAEGAVDLSRLPIDAVDRITVTRGGDAALYGPNALGGVVDIGGEIEEGYVLSGRVGSFGALRLSGGVGVAVGEQRFGLRGIVARSEGDYPFTFEEFGETRELRRTNAEARDIVGRLSWDGRIGEIRPGVTLDILENRRGIPGAVTQGGVRNPRAELDETEITGTIRVGGSIGPVATVGAVRLRNDRLEYRDPDVRSSGGDGLDLRYDRSDLFATTLATWIVNDASALSLRLELDRSRLDGDNLDPSVGGSVTRLRLGAALHGSRRFDSTFLGEQVRVDLGVRGDDFNDLGGRLSGSFGLAWQPAPIPLRFRFHAASTYRAPTFAEQYYLNVGNSDLAVERGTSLGLGATWLFADRLLLEGSLFSIDTRDRIVAIPRSPLVTTTLNIGRVLSRGAEIGLRGSIVPELLDGTLAYTRMETVDRTGGITDGQRIPYAPDETASASLSVETGLVRITSGLEYASHRHTLTFNTPESALSRYMLVRLDIAKEIAIGSIRATIAGEIDNLFDTEYMVVQGYPMPGRSVGIRVRGVMR